MPSRPALPATDRSGPNPPSSALQQVLRRRVAALGLVGALMVALPLVQVLRYQNAEIKALWSEKAGLDPVAQAVGTQRSLMTHRAISGLVLRGAADKEPERKQRQAEVDQQSALLGAAVHGGFWERAEAETSAMREDWAVLARQITARSIGAVESDQEHHLLIEQVLQVIDFVADEEPVSVGSGTPASRAVLAAALALPRVAAQMAALSLPAAERDGATRQHEQADAEAALARTLGALDRALDATLEAAGEHSQASDGLPRRELAQASATAGASSERYFGLLRNGRPAGTHPTDSAGEPRAAAADAAIQAELALFELAQGSVRDELARRVAQAEYQRNGLLLAMALLGLAAAALLGSLSRGLRPGPTPAPLTPASGSAAGAPGVGGSRAEAGRVMQRLRVPSREPADGSEDRAHGDAQPTIPPES